MRHRTKRPRSWIKLLGTTVYVLYCFVCLGIGTVAGWIGQSEVLVEVLTAKITNQTPDETFRSKALNLLVLGCDVDLAYGGKKVLKQQARSDMMLVARLDFDANRITGVSIPRDTLVAVPGYRDQKINAYHAIGGPDLAKRAVETLLPIQIDRVIVIDYDAFQEMVNLVGGVDVFVPKRMKYSDRRGGLVYDFAPGRHHLDGYEAMCYVRHRHSDSDFHRQERQKDFMVAFKEQALANKSVLNKVTDQLVALTGGKLSPREIAALMIFAQAVGPDNIDLGIIPVLEAGNYNLRVNQRMLPSTLEQYHFVEPTRVSAN